jgi:phospholipase/carboxylesterase
MADFHDNVPMISPPVHMMTYSLQEDARSVRLEPSAAASASVIWLHGLGADGRDFVPIVPQLELPSTLAVRFIFPHAPVRSVSINQGFNMRAWYDIKQISVGAAEDSAGIAESAKRLQGYLRRESESGIPPNRIAIAGFSQGGAMALHTALRFPDSLAGVLALSCYLPLRDQLATEASDANRGTPILMCHGRFDPVIAPELGLLSRDLLLRQGYRVQWRDYAMAHEVNTAEIADIGAWLRQVLGQAER